MTYNCMMHTSCGWVALVPAAEQQERAEAGVQGQVEARARLSTCGHGLRPCGGAHHARGGSWDGWLCGASIPPLGARHQPGEHQRLLRSIPPPHAQETNIYTKDSAFFVHGVGTHTSSKHALK